MVLAINPQGTAGSSGFISFPVILKLFGLSKSLNYLYFPQESNSDISLYYPFN